MVEILLWLQQYLHICQVRPEVSILLTACVRENMLFATSTLDNHKLQILCNYKKMSNSILGSAVRLIRFCLSLLELSRSRSSLNPLVRHGSGVSYGFPYSALEPGLGHAKLWFTLEELSLITNDFSTQNLLGRGGSCCVYKGLLLDGREVAVKQLKVDGAQGEREFKAEVEIISRVHHRHLVSLVGYCISENQRLLVYDYVPNRTLYHHLHGKK